MSKQEFKVSDRVAYYLGRIRHVTKVARVNTDGTLEIDPPYYCPDDPASPYRTAHPKQCRRLVKKARQRAYVVFRGGSAHSVFNFESTARGYVKTVGDGTVVEMVEVRRKGGKA